MAIRVAINGFGRVGRCVFRIGYGSNNIHFVAINDITDARTLAHLLKYDSVHRTYKEEVSYSEKSIAVNGKEIKVFSERTPETLPWADLGIDVVIEASGVFRDRKSAQMHIDKGAKKVIITAPAKEPDVTIAYGVNNEMYRPREHNIISTASCTTNCLAPMVSVIVKEFGMKRGFMTTVHSYTNDQIVLDAPHKDLRRARACNLSIIPTTTGAASALSLVIPEVKGKLDGMSLRVPTPDVSIVDLVCETEKKTTIEEVNQTFKKYANEEYKGIIVYLEEPLVSSDFIGTTASCCFDSELTNVLGSNFVKVFGWYDNEWGFSARVIDLISFVMKGA
ncbi:MAG: type I glyceraldehyde-3-phosphate dehydrogenase [bacterium]